MPRAEAATPAPGFLHDHPNFVDLLRQLAQQTGIATYLIEKDYWLMHGLWALQQQGWQFQLKGGTSLSKGFGIIQRFSEDIDLRIEPPAGQEVKTGKNQDKPAHIESRRQYFDWLAAEMGARALPGFESVERDTEYDDPKYRDAGIRLHYPVRTDYLPGIKEGILLEVGFDDTAPNTPCLISAWALDAALASPVQVIDNRAVEVPCYSPAYTFVEKLQTVSTKFRLQQAAASVDPAAPFPKNFLRHYYDLYCLLAHPEVLAFIGTPAYEVRKQQRFRAGDELDIARNPAFTLSEPTVRERYQRKYEETAGLYYAGQVPFEAILARIAEHIDRL
ncbi:nucleotidyl transferase AbiEii/AbiGii toxin family protein [Thauera aromatica]|uniref:nucleotidyl transferase AbiEii/AbiGii toxin family protein n=1 Tax=Thauera aromatica TaxID=59405 RepID=UPI001FFD0324|nr:nucleotidyl transferase AbiEii/AbiGii toxin family protein [Thauera aromatica]MCK2097635.1 nucleotidyl transferase AbiEii/AbiGii toxin family protein [Thauera aromatica]